MIKDPFYGVNEKSLQWIGEKDWEYKKTFIVDEALLQAPNVQLVFAGLDTYADIYINDYLVMKCDNMFRTWTFESSSLFEERGEYYPHLFPFYI